MMLFLLCVSSCGYQLVGTGALPEGISKLDVRILENRTSETGAESHFTNDLIEETARRGFYLPAADSGVLTGEIRNFLTHNLTHNPDATTYERRVTAVVDIRLLNGEGETVLMMDGLRQSEDYKVVEGDKAATEANRKNAIVLLSREFAIKVLDRISEDF